MKPRERARKERSSHKHEIVIAGVSRIGKYSHILTATGTCNGVPWKATRNGRPTDWVVSTPGLTVAERYQVRVRLLQTTRGGH